MASRIRFTLLLVGAVCPGVAFAYIDPGTGSILIQGLIAAIAAIGVTLKLYWHRFVAYFKRGKSHQAAEPSGEDDRSQS